MLVHLACNLDRERFACGVVTLFGPAGDHLESELSRAGIATTFLGKRRGPDPRMLWRLAELFRRERPDIVHTHCYVLRYVFPASVFSPGTRVVHTMHTVADRDTDRIGKLVQWVVFRSGTSVVAVGSRVAETIRDVYGIEPFATIANGTPIAPARNTVNSRRDWRAREQIPPDAMLFVFVGRLAAVKNVGALIEAFTASGAATRGGWLLIAGDGDQRQLLEDRARSLHVESRVKFLGMRHDVGDLLGAADVFVMSSKWEGTPLSVIEAMATGLPVVSTDVGGVSELVLHGTTGVLVRPDDGRALAAAFRGAIDRPDACARMGAAGAERARTLFSLKRMVDAYEQVYRQIAVTKGLGCKRNRSGP